MVLYVNKQMCYINLHQMDDNDEYVKKVPHLLEVVFFVNDNLHDSFNQKYPDNARVEINEAPSWKQSN